MSDISPEGHTVIRDLGRSGRGFINVYLVGGGGGGGGGENGGGVVGGEVWGLK